MEGITKRPKKIFNKLLIFPIIFFQFFCQDAANSCTARFFPIMQPSFFFTSDKNWKKNLSSGNVLFEKSSVFVTRRRPSFRESGSSAYVATFFFWTEKNQRLCDPAQSANLLHQMTVANQLNASWVLSNNTYPTLKLTRNKKYWCIYISFSWSLP